MKYYKKQRGLGALGMVLVIATLVCTLSFLILKTSDETNIVTSSNVANTLVAQASSIRSRILSCGLEFPQGNNGTSYRVQYPAATSDNTLNALTCPGAGSSVNIWTLVDGGSVPSNINGFGVWQYYNDASGLRLVITANNNERYQILSKVATMLGSQASVNNSTLQLTWIIVN